MPECAWRGYIDDIGLEGPSPSNIMFDKGFRCKSHLHVGIWAENMLQKPLGVAKTCQICVLGVHGVVIYNQCVRLHDLVVEFACAHETMCWNFSRLNLSSQVVHFESTHRVTSRVWKWCLTNYEFCADLRGIEISVTRSYTRRNLVHSNHGIND